jgi:uncharacterized protein YbbK (DUF523 family)/uncharacterized protein YbgA (DUF1722 family)
MGSQSLDIMTTNTTSSRPRVGISGCVLGEPVRYDGGHKRNHFSTGVLGKMVDFVSVCPEMEVGMGTPRPTLRLLFDKELGVRLVESKEGVDHTDAMTAWARTRAEQLATEDLDGFILQGKSPSCGMERVRVYRDSGMPHNESSSGLFAAALMERNPTLVVEEAQRLNDNRLRDNFCFRLFAVRRAKDLFRSEWRNGHVVDFHTKEKMALLARGRPAYMKIGQLVARVSEYERTEFADQYLALFHAALQPLPTRGRLLDALQHLAGHFKDQLLPQERIEFNESMNEFQVGRLPMSAVARLLRVLAARHENSWVADQSLLRPAPNALGLYNSAF